MLKQKHSIGDGDKQNDSGKTRPAASLANPQAIVFDADMIVAGILFHLADEGIGSTVDPASLQSLRRRLKRANSNVTVVKRTRWESMSNPQRLEWLLAVSESCYQVEDDATIAIGHRR